MTEKWTAQNIPDMSDKVVIITGANSGLGYESTLALVKKKATVIMACRNLEKAQSALDSIQQAVPDADTRIMSLNLGDLASVRQFVDEFKANYDRLDVLMNNAGVLGMPYQETPDGFETHIGVNHFGHYVLTGLLLETLLQTSQSRIVSVSSNLHHVGWINFDNINLKNRFHYLLAYNQSKLANVLFIKALNRRLQSAGHDTLAAVAHPGYTATNLQAKSGNLIDDLFVKYVGNGLIAHSNNAMGAWSQLYAATAPDVKGGAYYGPDWFGLRGHPVERTPSRAARNPEKADRLWQLSEEMTGVVYSF